MEHFRPPESLKLDCANLEEAWKLWKQKFENYMKASGSTVKADDVQLAIFLHVIGDDALAVYNTFAFPADDRNKLVPALRKFEEYCSPKKNIVFERYNFWRSVQTPGESIDMFVTTLRQKAKTCEFGDQTESMIRDRVVLGCPDARLQERLLRETDLDLVKAMNICRAAESTKAQLQTMKAEVQNVTQINAMHTTTVVPKDTVRDSRSCTKCGGVHKPRSCPAYGKECRICGKQNHFARVCRNKSEAAANKSARNQNADRLHRARSKSPARRQSQNRSIHAVEENSEQDSDDGEFFLGVLEETTPGNYSWWKMLQINDTPTHVKIDTGAQANVMSADTYQSLANKPALRSTLAVLHTYSNHAIKPIGIITATAQLKNCVHETPFYIVEQPVSTILGLPACQLFNIVEVDAVHEHTEDLIAEFQDVFSGTGKMPGKHHIVLDENIQPVIHPPRRVPFALEIKLKKALENLERKGIIECRDEPTDWVSSLLIVEKRDGSLRLC